MKKINAVLIFISIILAVSSKASAQGGWLAEKMQPVYDEISVKLRADPSIKNILIADFIDERPAHSKLGRQLADKLTFLFLNGKYSFNVIDRSLMGKLVEEAGLGAEGVFEPGANVKLGKLKEIDVVIKGTLTNAKNGDTRLNLTVTKLESLVLVASNSYEIIGVKDRQRKPVADAAPVATGSILQADTVGNLLFKLLDCRQTAQGIKATMDVTSVGTGDDLTVFGNAYGKHTCIIDAGNSKPSFSETITLDGRATVKQAEKKLTAGVPVTLSLFFLTVNGTVSTISNMEVICRSGNMGKGFSAVFNNIAVNR
jgi:hypothetical protein